MTFWCHLKNAVIFLQPTRAREKMLSEESTRKCSKLKFIYAMFTSNGHQFAWCINIQFNRVYSLILSHSLVLCSPSRLLFGSFLVKCANKKAFSKCSFSHQTASLLLIHTNLFSHSHLFTKVHEIRLPFLSFFLIFSISLSLYRSIFFSILDLCTSMLKKLDWLFVTSNVRTNDSSKWLNKRWLILRGH